jgi:GGDEF domain-containing protein
MDKDEEIEFLSVDKAFSILTRNALELKMECHLGEEADVAFIDFNNVHNMNLNYGYRTVNGVFTTIFKTFHFRKNDIVGRWFSGDEIVIAVYEKNVINNIIKRFKEHCQKYNVSFKHIIFYGVTSKEQLMGKIEEKTRDSNLYHEGRQTNQSCKRSLEEYAMLRIGYSR